MGHRIKTLEIESFLGINHRLTINFDGKTTLIAGGNGVGKTSIMRAIEYALFGNVYEMRGSQYSRNRNELNNNFAMDKEARIKLWLTDGVRETIIERTKEFDELNSEIHHLVIEGETIHSEKEKALEDWRRIGENEFYLQGYLTQENFAQILEYTPKNRSEAFNHLLNTDTLKFINEEYTSTIRYFKNKLDLIQKSSNVQEFENIDYQINEQKRKIRDLEKSFSVQFSSYEIDSLMQLFNKAKDLISEFEPINTFPELREQINNHIKQFKSSPQRITQKRTSIQEYFSWKTKVNDTLDALKLLEESYNELQSIIDKQGNEKELNLEKSKHKENLDEVERQLLEVDHLSKFLKIAVDEILEDHTRQCPICKNENFDVLEVKNDLSNQIRDLKTDDLDKLNNLHKQLQKKINELDDSIQKLHLLKQKIEETYNDYLTILEELQDQLPDEKEWKSFKTFPELKFSNFEENRMEIKQLLDDLEARVDEKIDEVEQITDESDQINVLSELIHLRDICDENLRIKKEEDELEKLEDKKLNLQTMSENMERKITKIEEIIEGLQEAQEVIINTQQAYIDQELSKLNPIIRKIYSLIEPHPYWSNMEIDLETKPRAGTLSTYFDLITRGEEVDEAVNVKAYFSKGQANRSILSLLLAIGPETAEALEFQLMDDITQSLDGRITRNFAKTCVELSDKVQLIISTADERLVDSFKSEFDDNFKSYNLIQLGEWSTEGTQIEQVINN